MIKMAGESACKYSARYIRTSRQNPGGKCEDPLETTHKTIFGDHRGDFHNGEFMLFLKTAPGGDRVYLFSCALKAVRRKIPVRIPDGDGHDQPF